MANTKLTQSLKLFSVLIFCILFINMASAFEFDNVGQYDPTTRTMTIVNGFGLGSDVATIQLISPLNMKVGAGYQQVAEFNIAVFQDYNSAFKELELYNKTNGGGNAKFNRNHDWKFLTTANVKVDDYIQECAYNQTTGNETCVWVVDGWHWEEKPAWEKITPSDFMDGDELTVGLFTEIDVGETVEWIPNFFGVRIDEWAVWTASLNTNILAYWKLDNDYTEEINSYTLTANAAPSFGTGIINQGSDLELSSSQYLSRAAGDLYPTLPFSVTLWIKPESLNNYYRPIYKASNPFGRVRYSMYQDTDGKMVAIVHNSTGTGVTTKSTSAISTGTWTMLTMVADGTDLRLYFDGTQEGTPAALTNLDNTAEQPLWIGREDTKYWDGLIDEVGVWERALTPTEVTQLYNGGSGISYIGGFGTDPIVTAISPDNATKSTTIGSKDFVCYGEDGENFTEMEFYVNGVINQSNATGLNATNYTFTVDLNDGDYNWSCIGYDDEANTGTFTARTYSIDSTTPTLSIIYPTATTYTTNVSELNFTATDDNLDSCWYSTDGGTTNSTSNDCSSNFTGITSTEGSNTWNLYINDTFGNSNSASVTFSKDTISPFIEIVSPTSTNKIYSTQLINITATDDNLDTINYEFNGTNFTYTTPLNVEFADGTYNLIAYVNDTFGNSNSTNVTFNIDTTPFIEFLTPPTLVNYANITQEYIPMKVNVSPTTYFKNITYYLQNANGTEYTQYYETETFDINFTDMPDAHYHYNVTVCTTTEKCNTTETRHVNHDVTAPTLSNAIGFTDIVTATLPVNSTWNYTANDEHIDSCYYNYTGSPTYDVITCNATQVTNWTTNGEKTIQYCANDTFGNEACLTEIIYVVEYSQTDNPDPSVEAFDTTFTLNLNSTNIPLASASLNINGSVYSTTPVISTDTIVFTKILQIPDTWGNATGVLHDWYFNISGNFTGDTETTNVTVLELAIDDCSTYGDLILNMSLLDEEFGTVVNESLGSNVEIDLTLTSKTNSSYSLDYAKTWTDDNNPWVCLPNNVLNNTEFWMDFTIGFSSTDHVWEFYYLDNATLNSTKIFDVQTSTPLHLYDLLTADSTSFLFNYFDNSGLTVDDTIVHVYRKYIGSGVFKEVERAKADENGDTIVHLVEEDVIYYFVISQYGEILYTSSTYTALCQATPCTIQIEASGESATFPTDWDLVDGGAYSIYASSSTRIVNLTYTAETPQEFNLTVFKFESDGSYTPIESVSETGTSGSVTITVPQSAGNVTFFASVYVEDEFIGSDWIDFENGIGDSIGTKLALFLAVLIILSLGLIAVSEGTGTIVFVILGIFISGALGLMTTKLSPTINVVTYLVIAGGILMYKISRNRQ